jgi:hypothetical protein
MGQTLTMPLQLLTSKMHEVLCQPFSHGSKLKDRHFNFDPKMNSK